MDANIDLSNISIDTIEQYTTYIINQHTRTYDAIAALPLESLSFANIWEKFVETEISVGHMAAIVSYIHQLHINSDVRNASSNANTKLKKLGIECSLRKDVYTTIQKYYDQVYPVEKPKLNHEQNRMVENTMREYRRNGLHLDNPQIKELKQQLADLETAFSKNINDENTTFVMDKKELDGLPESWFDDSKVVDKKIPTYKVTLKYPDYIPIMEYCTNQSTRQKMYMAYNQRVADTNNSILNQIVSIRHQLANLLGYKTHAHYKLETKMAKTPETVYTFLQNLIAGFEPLLQKNLTDITNFAKNYGPNPLSTPNLNKWDLSYYNRLYKEATLSIDMEQLKAYFPTEHVLNAVNEIYQQLLGVHFIHIPTKNIWHPSVKLYQVRDANSNAIIGHFYLDLFPRDGKYSHACVMPFVNGCAMPNGTDRQLPVAVMACNFPESGFVNGLTFKDVETYFHEFGHLMHQILSRTQYLDHNGFGVERDFVEAPSQMLEFWCYQDASLKILSKHKDTGETVPADIVSNLKKLKIIDSGLFNRRQLLFGKFDMIIHSEKVDDVNVVFHKLEKEILLLDVPTEIKPASSFGHMVGYDAGYYGYMYSEALACDMFKTVFENNVLDPTKGMHYRHTILEPGSSYDAIDLVRNFLGREPNNNAFLEIKGLVK